MSWKPVEERKTKGLTFDDVFLAPAPSEILPREAETSSLLCRGITLRAPFVSSPMDRVTEERMAIAMALFGGIGVLHRGMKHDRLLEAVKRVKRFMAGKIDQPVTVTPEMTLGQIEELAVPYTGFPVIEELPPGKRMLIGIITRRDRDGQSKEALVKEVMTPLEEMITSPLEIELDEALRLMQRHKIEKLPLVDEEGMLLRLMTRRDLDSRTSFPNATVDSKGRLRVGAAVKGSDRQEMLKLIDKLIKAGVDAVVVDSAHGGNVQIVKAIRAIKYSFPALPVIGGNVADGESAKELIAAGADALRVGVGPGSICTTRTVTGIGVPQITAVSDCRQAVEERANGEIPIIADGGISESGQIIKALAAGASTVMFGNLLAGTDEAPGEIISRGGRSFKGYRGMGSRAAMIEHGGERYFQTGSGKLVPEGVSGTVPYRGKTMELLEAFLRALQGGMGYVGAKTIPDLWQARLVQVTAAGLRESHPHHLASIEGESPTSMEEE